MDDDIDFDDLLGEERAVESMTTKTTPHSQAAPSANEIRLARRVLDLEKERDTLAAELTNIKSKQSTSPIVPLPSSTLSASAPALQPITIPHELLPTLQLLRQHISELTRDNAALRYTFLGQQSADVQGRRQEGSSPIIPSLDQASISQSNPLVDPVEILPAISGLDVEKVVQRVKAVMLENEELGLMVLEAGKSGGMQAEWQKAIDESKAVIESLDSDLTLHLTTIQALRAELLAAKSQTPIAAPPTAPSRSHHHKTPSISHSHSQASGSTPRGPSGRSRTDRDKDRERPRERIRDTEIPTGPSVKKEDTGGGNRALTSTGSLGRGVSGRGEKHRDSERDSSKEPPKGPRDDRDVKRRK